MKKINLFIIFLFISQNLFAQSIKYKAISSGISQKINGRFEFPNYEKDNSVIVIDTKKNSLIVYGKEERTYDIYNNGEKMKLENGDSIYEFYAIDPEGKKCLIRNIFIEKVNPKTNCTGQLYIIYENYQIVFNLT